MKYIYNTQIIQYNAHIIQIQYSDNENRLKTDKMRKSHICNREYGTFVSNTIKIQCKHEYNGNS